MSGESAMESEVPTIPTVDLLFFSTVIDLPVFPREGIFPYSRNFCEVSNINCYRVLPKRNFYEFCLGKAL